MTPDMKTQPLERLEWLTELAFEGGFAPSLGFFPHPEIFPKSTKAATIATTTMT